MMQSGKPIKLAPTYQGMFYISYKLVIRIWHGKTLNMFDIPISVVMPSNLEAANMANGM